MRASRFWVLLVALGGCSAQPAPDVTPAQLAILGGGQSWPVAIDTPAGNLAPVAGSQPAPLVAAAEATSPGAEKLVVTAPARLTGTWEIMAPREIRIDVGIGAGSGLTYSAISPHLCRFVQHGGAVGGNCLADTLRPLTGTYENGELHGHLGPFVLDADVSGSNHLKGGMKLSVLGLGVSPAVPVAGWRLVGQSPTPAPAGTEAVVRGMLASVAAGQPTGAAFVQADLAGLGTLQSLSYIGTILIAEGANPDALHLSVFAADFDGGSRLCGVAVTPRGAATRFLCG